MTLRHIKTYTDGKNQAKVHKDTEWNEYRVSLHKDGFHMGDAHDYHTDDLEDAHGTAKLGLKHMKSHEEDHVEEELQEISKGLADRYFNKASDARNKLRYGDEIARTSAGDRTFSGGDRSPEGRRKMRNRKQGMERAMKISDKHWARANPDHPIAKKILGEGEMLSFSEWLELDELSKDLLQRYVKKGDRSYDHLVDRSYKDWKHAGEIPHTHPYAKKAVAIAKKSTAKADNRAKYLNKADDRLKEDTLDELSVGLVKRYLKAKKASPGKDYPNPMSFRKAMEIGQVARSKAGLRPRRGDPKPVKVMATGAKPRPSRRRPSIWEDKLDELSSRTTLSYLNAACKDRMEAEKCGDDKRMKKRERGAFRAIDAYNRKKGLPDKKPRK